MILKRQLYSEYYYFEQREYGIGSKILKAGKNKLAKTRKRIYDKLDKFSEDQYKLNESISKELKELHKKQKPNKELTNKILKEAEKDNIGIYGNNDPAKLLTFIKKGEELTRIISQDPVKVKKGFKLLEYEPEGKEKEVLDSFYKSGGNIINISGKLENNNIISSHELGHWKNRKSGDWTELISKLDNKVREHKDIKFTNDPKRGPIKNSLSRIGTSLKNIGKDIGERLITPIEERNAWRKGKQLLKKSGASNEDLKLADEIKKKSLKSYTSGINAKLAEKYKNKFK